MSKVMSLYLSETLDVSSLKNIVYDLSVKLQPMSDEFDAIAVRGMSGSLVGPQIAMNLDKQLIIVRKETSHSCSKVEGYFSNNTRYIIVDDFIGTGATVRSIIDNIQESCHVSMYKATCVGLAMYKQSLYGVSKFTQELVPDAKVVVARWCD